MTLPPELSAILRDPLARLDDPGSDLPTVAFMSNNVPVELIHASGCFPLQLPTAPRRATPRADRYLEGRFDPFVRVALERLLAGELPELQLLVLPRSVDSLQRLYYYACELRRSFGESLPECFLYDVLHTPWYSSAEYSHTRTQAFAERLAQLRGRPRDDERLAASIALYNQVRAQLDAVLTRRYAAPCALRGTTAFAVLTAAHRMRPESFLTLLRGLCDAPPESAPGTRTLLIGSAHDTHVVHELIARAGGQVVGDYHARGELLLGPPLDETLPPLRSISSHYQRDSISPRSFPATVEPLVRLARRARAEAAIFFYYVEEEALTWDYPAQARALHELGLPTLRLGAQPYPTTEALLPALEAFFADPRAARTHTLPKES